MFLKYNEEVKMQPQDANTVRREEYTGVYSALYSDA